MQELKLDLLTSKYTKVYINDEKSHNTNHEFEVISVDGRSLTNVKFQKGPIKECGVNGCCNEDLIAMVIHRLKNFQDTDFRCKENAVAITKLEETLLWLRKRTMAREARGVEGTREL